MKRAPFTIPRKLKIRGKTWKVKRERQLQGRAKKDMRGAVGMTRRDLREIHIADRERGWSAATTMVHEILHACSRQVVHWKTEEKFIRDVEVALLEALKQLRWRR